MRASLIKTPCVNLTSNTKIAINGRFLTRPVTGVDRYAREIVRELDGMYEAGEACIVVPEAARIIDPIPLANIELIRYGKHHGHLWEQLDYAHLLRREQMLGLSLCNTAPVFNPGIVCIHDMNVRANPGFYSWKFRTAYRVMFAFLSRNAEVVLTNSEFSKREIMKYYPAASGKITVIPCAWQHIDRVQADKAFLEHAGIEAGSYYFAMSSLAPNKNLRWVVETALLNPTELFLVAGGVNGKVFGEHDIPEAANVVYLGYVTDGQAKALMQGCKAFLFPTFYEGFGIPPLEALACGAEALVSDTEVMHEVYTDSVAYLSPTLPCKGLKRLCQMPQRSDDQEILKRYSWNQSASRIRSIVEAIDQG